MDRTPQDDLLVIEALVTFSYDRQDIQPERAARAWCSLEISPASTASASKMRFGSELDSESRDPTRFGAGVIFPRPLSLRAELTS